MLDKYAEIDRRCIPKGITGMARKRSNKEVSYTDDKLEEHCGEVVERNGNLSWVIDSKTGEGSYRAPHEISEGW